MGTIYLAGPIDKVSAESASSWRDEAAKILAVEFNHVVCDPNRTWVTNPATRGTHPARENAVIVQADLSAVDGCDALLVFCDKDTLACGTYIETGFAYSKGKTMAFYTTGRFPGFITGLVELIHIKYPFSQKARVFNDLRLACEWLNAEVRKIDDAN